MTTYYNQDDNSQDASYEEFLNSIAPNHEIYFPDSDAELLDPELEAELEVMDDTPDLEDDIDDDDLLSDWMLDDEDEDF